MIAAPKTTSGAVRLLLALLAILATVPVPAFAQRERAVGPRADIAQRFWLQLDQRIEEFSKTLSLTEEQSSQVIAVVEEFRQTNEDALGRMTAMAAEIRALAEEQSNVRERRRAMAEVAEKHGNPAQELAPAFADLRSDVTELRDPEHQRRLNRMFARRTGRRPPGR